MQERGQIDLVLGPQGMADPTAGLEFIPLIDDSVGVLCRIGHPLAGKKGIVSADLEKQNWLAHSRGSLLRQQTEAALISSGIKSMQILCETDSIRSSLEIIANTDLLTTMPKATTSPYLEARLVFLDFNHPQFNRPLGAIRRAETPPTLIGERFLAMLKSMLQAKLSGRN